MRIFFRYLMLELLKPFLFCLVATSALWIVADLFSSLDDFIEHNASWMLLLKFYGAQVPKMLELTLPMSILFASLYTIIRMARHSEFTALQAGGMSPLLMFSPFLILAGICTLVLFIIMAWPATQSEAIRAEILNNLRASPNQRGIKNRLTYIDKDQNRIWYIKLLNTSNDQAVDVEVLQRDPQNHDVEKYFSGYAVYKDGFWTFHNTKHFKYGPDNHVTSQEKQQTIELPSYTISPQQLAFTISDPKQLTLTQLWTFLNNTKGSDTEHLAPFRTQFWYLFAYPSIVLVLIVFAIAMGAQHDRRAGAAAGVFNAIFVLLAFYFTMGFFESMGGGNRISPFVAAWSGPVIFGAAGIFLLSWRFGWLWHLQRLVQQKADTLPWLAAILGRTARTKDALSTSARDLRLKSLKLLLDKVTRQNPAYPGSETAAAEAKEQNAGDDAKPADKTSGATDDKKDETKEDAKAEAKESAQDKAKAEGKDSPKDEPKDTPAPAEDKPKETEAPTDTKDKPL